MNKDRNLDHDFLTLRAEDKAERTFLGGLRTGQRMRIFVIAALLGIILLVVLFGAADRRLSGALDGSLQATRAASLVARMESGIAGARSEEKRFLLEKDPVLADGFDRSLTRAQAALERLAGINASATVVQHIDTVRDGLAQYDQHFGKLVDSERALGLTDGSGLSGKLKEATETLQAKFATAGFANLAGQVARINQEGHETLLSGYKVGVAEIQKRYQTLGEFLKGTNLPSKRKAELQELIQKHETNMLAMINSRFSFADESARFDEIIAYLSPSLGALGRFANAETRKADAVLADTRRLARLALAGGTAVVVVALMVLAVVLLNASAGAMHLLASAAGRIADGDRAVNIPARGNSDAAGTVARALDRWLDNLADLDQVRLELQSTRDALQRTQAEAQADALAAAEAARAALLSDETEAAPTPGAPSRYAGLGPDEPPPVGGRGPISSVSRQLANFSEYVTAAAGDVERTEALIKGLEDAGREIDAMSALVTSIRDQINLLAFRSGPKGPGADNVVSLAGDEHGTEDGAADVDMAERFDAIRDATERAERTALSVRNTLADVTRTAQEIAATASAQALEATSKLLSQSEYLQNMLDDVMSKIQPAGPGQMTETAPAAGEGKTPGKPISAKD